MVVGAGSVCALLVFGVIGYFFADRGLSPLRDTLERGRRLLNSSGREQLTAENPDDETSQFVSLFNDLRERLEGSFPELDRLTADLSHELRTPLTAMRAVGEVAMKERNPAILYDAVGSMLEEIRRMNQLIDRLLLLTRGERSEIPMRLRAAPVRAVLVEVSDTLISVAEDKQQRLRVECEEGVRAIFDQALLRLALVNLAQNAIRYSPAGTAVTLRGAADGREVIVDVADEGPGIAPEHRRKVFERFYRVDRARSRADGGVGLGLAIVKWSVERMGGKVELESKVGQGSVFRLRLPRAAD